MKNREDGLLVIKERLKDNKSLLGIKTFRRTPTKQPSSSEIPYVFMVEDVDTILRKSARGALGYPHRRMLEVTIGVVVDENEDPSAFYRSIRKIILSEPSLTPLATTYELRAEGPFPANVPNTKGMNLVLGLEYVDEGL